MNSSYVANVSNISNFSNITIENRTQECLGIAVYNAVTATRDHVSSMDSASLSISVCVAVAGLVICFVGYLIIEPCLATSGFLIGVAVAYGFIHDQKQMNIDLCTRGLAYALFSGVVGSILFIAVARCALWIIVFIALMVIGHELADELGTHHIDDQNTFLDVPLFPQWLVIFIVSLTLSFISRRYKKYTYAFTTSAFGAWCTSSGIKSSIAENDVPQWIFSIVVLVLFSFGFATQIYLMKRLKQKKDDDDDENKNKQKNKKQKTKQKNKNERNDNTEDESLDT